MYLIKLRFDGNEDGIYTYEEETASDIEWAKKKYQRMINRWYSILNERGSINVTLQDIENVITSLNRNDNGKRKFTIEIFVKSFVWKFENI